MNELNTPLSEAELAELDAFLMSEAVGEEAMDIPMLDGLCTALVVGPVAVPPSQWLPLVWDKEEMVWASEAQATAMINLVMRHMNSVAVLFQEAPKEFEPLLAFRQEGEREVAVLDEWCTGFALGVALAGEAWEPMMEDEENQVLLTPIMLYGTQDGWQAMQDDAKLAGRHEEFVETLPACILGIKDFWDSYRKALSSIKTVRYEDKQPGRNDACPCGSGKKYKKCCGSA